MICLLPLVLNGKCQKDDDRDSVIEFTEMKQTIQDLKPNTTIIGRSRHITTTRMSFYQNH